MLTNSTESLNLTEKMKQVVNDNWGTAWTATQLAKELEARGIPTTSVYTFLNTHRGYFHIRSVPNTEGTSTRKTVLSYRLRKKIPMGTIFGLYAGRSRPDKAKVQTPVIEKTILTSTAPASINEVSEFKVKFVKNFHLDAITDTPTARMRQALKLNTLAVGDAAIVDITDPKAFSLAQSVVGAHRRSTKQVIRTTAINNKTQLVIQRIS